MVAAAASTTLCTVKLRTGIARSHNIATCPHLVERVASHGISHVAAPASHQHRTAVASTANPSLCCRAAYSAVLLPHAMLSSRARGDSGRKGVVRPCSAMLALSSATKRSTWRERGEGVGVTG